MTLHEFKYHLVTIATVAVIFITGMPSYSQERSDFDVITTATPNGDTLRAADEGPIRSALGQPKVDLNTYALSVVGMVNSPLVLTWEEIQALPVAYSDTTIMYCIEGWEVWGNWKGFLVKELLETASVQKKGEHVKFTCLDGYTTSLPIKYIKKYNVMLAYEVNGKPLKRHDGFPLRLIAFGKYGYKWAKGVSKLEVISSTKKGFWEVRGYPDRADVPLERRKYFEGDRAKKLKY